MSLFYHLWVDHKAKVIDAHSKKSRALLNVELCLLFKLLKRHKLLYWGQFLY